MRKTTHCQETSSIGTGNLTIKMLKPLLEKMVNMQDRSAASELVQEPFTKGMETTCLAKAALSEGCKKQTANS